MLGRGLRFWFRGLARLVRLNELDVVLAVDLDLLTLLQGAKSSDVVDAKPGRPRIEIVDDGLIPHGVGERAQARERARRGDAAQEQPDAG